MKVYTSDVCWYNNENGDSGYTLRHKIRLALGVHGERHDGSWCFGHLPKWVPFKIARGFYSFMFYVGDPILNFIIGYKKSK